MGRFCGTLLNLFRILQLLLSVIVLGLAIFIIQTRLSIASDAHELESGILFLQNSTNRHQLMHDYGISTSDDDKVVQGFLDFLSKMFVPVLQSMQEMPKRAILLTTTALWAIFTIIYLLIAQRSVESKINKRSVRVILEVITLLSWAVGVGCAALLSLEYGFLALAGGPETKLALTALRPLLKEVFTNTFNSGNFVRALAIINNLVTVGALSIFATIAASVCTVISCVSLFIACCMSGKENKQKQKQKQNHSSPQVEEVEVSTKHEKQHTGYLAIEKSLPLTPFTPGLPTTYSHHTKYIRSHSYFNLA